MALKKGQHANKNENEKTNPFPSLLIGIKGMAKVIIGDKKSFLSAGEAVFIPVNTRHEFLNHSETLFEAILIMFGKGA